VKKGNGRDSSLLSVKLESFIEVEDDFGHENDLLTREERVDFERIVRAATSSLEGFTEPWATKLLDLLRDNPDSWEGFVDDHYSREVVGSLGGIVRRFMRLAPVLIGIAPSEEVRLYLREATRCYIYGFFEASIVLSRAALEAALNHYLKRRLGAIPSQQLVAKVKSANKWKLLSSQSAAMAEDLAKAAGMVLHQRPAKSERLAFDTLVRARGVLRELFQC
jgi:hypothetical protein